METPPTLGDALGRVHRCSFPKFRMAQGSWAHAHQKLGRAVISRWIREGPRPWMETLPSFSLQTSKLEMCGHVEQEGASPPLQSSRTIFVLWLGENSVSSPAVPWFFPSGHTLAQWAEKPGSGEFRDGAFRGKSATGVSIIQVFFLSWFILSSEPCLTACTSCHPCPVVSHQLALSAPALQACSFFVFFLKPLCEL